MRETIRDKGRLEHIVEAIGRILDFMADKTFEEISKDKLEYYGIVKCIEIVGEATYKLSSQFKIAHPETPWDNIEKMRHVLVHDYYQIDENEVRYVIEDDLRPLQEQINRYISETDWDKWERTNSK